VISEAIVSGLPVIASRIPGNVGLLGEEYPGYFEAGDTNELARLLELAEMDSDFIEDLRYRCGKRAGLFAPAAERRAWERLLGESPMGPLH